MPAIAERKCRGCGRWSKVAFNSKCCQHCMAEYGRWTIGLDREIPVKTTTRRTR